MNKTTMIPLLLVLSISTLTGCGNVKDASLKLNPPIPSPSAVSKETPSASKTPPHDSTPNSPAPSANSAVTVGKEVSADTGGSAGKGGAVQVVANPNSITVLVNKHFALPPDYTPSDLINDPNIPFIFSGYDEKRLMRKEMAQALEKLFAGAKQDGIYLAGVSAYRSYATQKAVFDGYVHEDGEAKALTYSALPGTSEHETGLAIDVSGSDGKCAAADCFAGSKEANWIAQHASEYGFILRYQKGKESITGYEYEPWHIRYVGTTVSKEIAKRGITLEEYLHAVPVSK